MQQDKPISLILDDLRCEIAKDINSKQLPPCLIVPILKDFYFEALEIEKQQLEKDKKEYKEKNKEVKE